jgi:hypothetical protein
MHFLRVEGNTKKILNILCLFCGFLSKVEGFAKGIRKYTVVTYFKRVEGPPFFLRIFLLPSPSPFPAQCYVLHNYVPNSDEGLTDRTLGLLQLCTLEKFISTPLAGGWGRWGGTVGVCINSPGLTQPNTPYHQHFLWALSCLSYHR